MVTIGWVLKKPKFGRFYLTLITLNIGAISVGLTMGLSTASIREFDDFGNTEKYIVLKDASLVEMAIFTGASLGVLVPIFIVDVYGRRTTFIVFGVVNATSWILLASARDMAFIITGSFVGGFAVGIFLTTASLFVSEISLPENRGIVATMTTFSGYFGIFIIRYLGIHVDLQFLAPGMMGLTICFITSTSLWMNESPYYLYKCGRVLDAKLSLMTLRGRTTILEIDEEHKSMVQFFNSEIEYPTRVKRMIILMFGSGKMETSMIFLLMTLCTTQVIGSYAMSNYVNSIVSTKLPRYGTVLLALMNFVSVVCCLGTIEKVGRKFILKLSCVGSSTCYLIIVIFNFYYGTKCEPEDTTIPLIIVSTIYYVIYTFGVIPVIPVVTSEIFPSKIKTIAIGFCFSFMYLANLIIAWLYFTLSRVMGVCQTFAIFTFTGAIGLPVIICSLPETKGKSLYEIQHELKNEVLDPVIPSY